MKGHVYKRGKNWSYLFNIDPDPLTGKRRQSNGSGYRTEREAWKACRDAMAEHEKGRAVSSSRRKVAEARTASFILALLDDGFLPGAVSRVAGGWRGTA